MMASLVPARVLGLADRGRLAPGYRADLAVLSRELTPIRTFAGGEDPLIAPLSSDRNLDEIPPSTCAHGPVSP